MIRMLQKPIKIAVLIALFWFITATAFAQPVSSADLINNAKQYDGKVVDYKGEVIGDVMIRGQYAWVNINDGQNAIGIMCDRFLIKEIRCGGSYKFKGDIIEVRSIFHRACLEHGGDLDIHAQSINKITPGKEILESLSLNKLKTAFVLLVVLIILSL